MGKVEGDGCGEGKRRRGVWRGGGGGEGKRGEGRRGGKGRWGGGGGEWVVGWTREVKMQADGEERGGGREG